MISPLLFSRPSVQLWVPPLALHLLAYVLSYPLTSGATRRRVIYRVRLWRLSTQQRRATMRNSIYPHLVASIHPPILDNHPSSKVPIQSSKPTRYRVMALMQRHSACMQALQMTLGTLHGPLQRRRAFLAIILSVLLYLFQLSGASLLSTIMRL